MNTPTTALHRNPACYFPALRVASVGVVVLLAASLETRVYQLTFFNLLLIHYTLGAIYAKHYASKMMESKIRIALFVGLAGLSVYLGIFTPFPVRYLIIPHVALSEVYMPLVRIGSHYEGSRLDRALRGAYIVLIMLFLTHDPLVAAVPLYAQFGILIALLAAMAIRFSSTERKLLAFELSALLIFVGLTISGAKTLVPHLVFYHIATWYVYPILSPYRPFKMKQAKSFSMKVGICLCLFILCFTIGVFPDVSEASFGKIIALLATIHILTTFALSDMNPAVIKGFFRWQKVTLN